MNRKNSCNFYIFSLLKIYCINHLKNRYESKKWKIKNKINRNQDHLRKIEQRINKKYVMLENK